MKSISCQALNCCLTQTQGKWNLSPWTLTMFTCTATSSYVLHFLSLRHPPNHQGAFFYKTQSKWLLRKCDCTLFWCIRALKLVQETCFHEHLVAQFSLNKANNSIFKCHVKASAVLSLCTAVHHRLVALVFTHYYWWLPMRCQVTVYGPNPNPVDQQLKEQVAEVYFRLPDLEIVTLWGYCLWKQSTSLNAL